VTNIAGTFRITGQFFMDFGFIWIQYFVSGIIGKKLQELQVSMHPGGSIGLIGRNRFRRRQIDASGAGFDDPLVEGNLPL
jgi:hypothetical protein